MRQRINWIRWMLRMRRYVSFDWTHGPWPKSKPSPEVCPLCGTPSEDTG